MASGHSSTPEAGHSPAPVNRRSTVPDATGQFAPKTRRTPTSEAGHCGQEFIQQFEKCLHVSNQKGRVRRKRKTKVKRTFSLRPPQLKIPPPKGDKMEHFSFETCSKELESIMQKSNPIIRPRSSSLPSKSSHKSPVVATVIAKPKKKKPVAKTQTQTCAQQANLSQDIDRLTDYLEESILLPKKMSYMAEMMYT